MRSMIGLLTLLGILTAGPTDGQPSILNETRTVEISYEVKELPGLNSEVLEFSPVMYKDQLVFTSDREYNMVNVGEQMWKEHPHLNLFIVDVKSYSEDSLEFSKPELFENLFTSMSHTGPIAFSEDGNMAVFTQVTHKKIKGQDKVKVHKPALFYSELDGSKWSKPIIVPFVDVNYSYGHPSLSKDGKTLYFSSSMPGGQGGDDIYVSTFDGTNWSAPKNLGPEVNSEANEVFPSFYNEVLYFSSNRKESMGGLDLFKSELKENAFQTAQKLEEPINSKEDDFGLIFRSDNVGYFSSNRAEGKGKDDIYMFKVNETVTIESDFLAGKFNYRNLDGNVEGMKVMLYDEDGNLVMDTKTNENGEFIFKHLGRDEEYRIKIEGEEDMELIIYNLDGETVATLMSDAKGEFIYKRLPPGDVGTMALMDPEDMDDNLGTLDGQFVFEHLPTKFASNMKVMLVDENGDIQFTTTTDEYGNFEFKNLPANSNYLVRMEEVDENLTLLIFNKDDNVTAVLRMDGQGDFVYKKLQQKYAGNLELMETEDLDLFEDIKGNIFGRFIHKKKEQKFGDGLDFLVYDKDGNLVLKTKSDEKGFFRLNNLPLTDSYMFQLDEGDLVFGDDIQMVIMNREGTQIAILDKDKKDFFVYTPLGLAGKIDLTEMGYEDMTLENFAKEIPTIYYERGSSYLSTKSRKILDNLIKEMKENPSIKIEVNSYADSRASAEFNLKLSGKRSNSVLKYLKSKGIPSDRMGGNAYGESKLLNDCGDGVECPEELHQLNRRSEIRVY